MEQSEKSKMLAGELYDSLDPELTADRTRARELLRILNSTLETQNSDANPLMKELFGSIGKNVAIQPPFYCDYGFNIVMGEHVFFNFNCIVLDVCEVRIGDHCLFGPGVQIYTATHPMQARLRRRQESGQPIVIGSDVWVGGGAILCPGITIGPRSVIGAGSVVTRDIPADVFAAGNPCRIIRAIAHEETTSGVAPSNPV